MKNCPKCGKAVPDNAKFCPYDNHQFSTSTPLPFGIIIVGCLCLVAAGAAAINFISNQTSTSGNNGIVYPTATEYVPQLPPTEEYNPAPTNTTRPQSARPTATSKPSSSLQPIPANYSCPDKDKVELQVGASGKIRKYDVNLRKEPKVPDQWDANVIRVLHDGENVKVIDGPVCAHDGTWWKVTTESSNVGWVRELQPSTGRLIVRTGP